MVPYAGPELDNSQVRASIDLSMPGSGSGMPSMGSFMGGTDEAMTDYLLDHWKNETYLVAVPNANTAAGIILETSMPVMAVGGFIRIRSDPDGRPAGEDGRGRRSEVFPDDGWPGRSIR